MDTIKYKTVLVTGGSGFVGKRLSIFKPKWNYISSKDLNLLNLDACINFFSINKFDAVIHLAAKTGGIEENTNNQSEMYFLNSIMNNNIIYACQKSGIKRLLSCLSTCSYPDIVNNYPMKEDTFLNGEVTDSNYGYGLSKRELFRQSNFCRKFYNLNYSCFTPCNLYGPDSNFNDKKSHLIGSILKKVHLSKDGQTIEVLGNGEAYRQHLYIDDLASIIPQLLILHNNSIPLNVASEENFQVKEIIDMVRKILKKKIEFKFTNTFLGQFRKDVSIYNLKKLIPKIKFTTLQEGIFQTYKWFLKIN
jgi:GDP-L-fucose synthase